MSTQPDTIRTADQTAGQDSSGRFDNARDTAAQAGARASETIEANPLGVLAGGLALGAIAGALIPRSDRERELLRPVGAKLGATAAAAFTAAKEAGRAEMENRGLTPDAAREQAKTLVSNVGKAASGAATAAAQSARQEATGATGEPDATARPDSTGGTGDYVPPVDPHRQVVAGDRETSFNPGV